MGGFRAVVFLVLVFGFRERELFVSGGVVQRTVSRPREMVPTNLESVIRGARILIVVIQDDRLALRL
jgi:hypothetical protein